MSEIYKIGIFPGQTPDSGIVGFSSELANMYPHAVDRIIVALTEVRKARPAASPYPGYVLSAEIAPVDDHVLSLLAEHGENINVGNFEDGVPVEDYR